MTNKSNPADSTQRRPWLAAAAVALALAAGVTAAITHDSRGGSQASPPARTQQTFVAAPSVGIKNFGRVNENFYRGAQPDPAGFAELKKLGVKTVIDLREDKKRHAAGWVRAAGMEYVNIPLRASRPATEDETRQFLQLVNDPANWPVYVHCKGGRHRTGALVAVYRITHDGWSAHLAFKEMLDYDFDKGGLFGGGDGRERQKQFVYDFYERHVAAGGGSKPQAAPAKP
ncbi:MAG TPA: tyrosine-protein phosphatase [Pyrinomonadaceae bacterium]|nr:tyrosine-protein phosphatase [Pyrinomonadaceae bacterium]